MVFKFHRKMKRDIAIFLDNRNVKKGKMRNFLENVKSVREGFMFIPKSMVTDLLKMNGFVAACTYGERIEVPVMKANGMWARKKIYIAPEIRNGEIGRYDEVRILVKE